MKSQLEEPPWVPQVEWRARPRYELQVLQTFQSTCGLVGLSSNQPLYCFYLSFAILAERLDLP